MKKMILWLTVATLLMSGAIFGGVRWLSSRQLQSAVVDCSKKGDSKVVAITGNRMVPLHTEAKTCETLTIVNTDNAKRLIAFGHHDHHQAYDGVTEKSLAKGQSFTITFNETGEYTFHDHLHDETAGTFTVTK